MELDGDAPTPADPVVETAAIYLARRLVAERGFVPGSFAEARPLGEACHVILTASDGRSITIACLLDRDAEPTAQFTLAADAVEAAAAACRVHAGSLHGHRMPVTVEIWEVGAGLPGPGDRERLAALTRHRGGRSGIAIGAIVVDSATGAVVTTVTGAEQQAHEAWVRRQLTGPRRVDAAPAAPRRIAFTGRRPVATYALLAVLAAVFVVELVLSPGTTGDSKPPLGVLVGLGGLEHARFADGEVWRMLTAALLHGGLLHIVFNGIALFMAGTVLEQLVGWTWMLALFVIGALGGGAASLVANPANVTTVGASGAIMGMLAAGICIGLRLPRGRGRIALMLSLGQILVPSLLPLATASTGGGQVDLAAHIGGAIAGAAVGILLLVTWPARSIEPRGRGLARAALGLGAIGLVVALVALAGSWRDVRAEIDVDGQLAPQPEVQAIIADEVPPDRVAALLARYPRDPWVRYVAAIGALHAGEIVVARGHIEAALAEQHALHRLGSPGLEIGLHEWLAAIRDVQGDHAAARAAIAPACGSPLPSPLPAGLRARLCAPSP